MEIEGVFSNVNESAVVHLSGCYLLIHGCVPRAFCFIDVVLVGRIKVGVILNKVVK